MKRSIMSIICGSLIKEIREGQNIGLEYAASVSGICTSKLSKIENGYQLLDMIALCELCKVYDMEPGAFISIVGTQYLRHYPVICKKKGIAKA
jgi:transcriptional regulator with XRE-family HTH domain